MREGRDASLARSIATLGMALFAPLAFFTGLWTFATMWAGTPRPLMAIFLIAVSGTAFFTLLYLATDIRDRAHSDD